MISRAMRGPSNLVRQFLILGLLLFFGRKGLSCEFFNAQPLEPAGGHLWHEGDNQRVPSSEGDQPNPQRGVENEMPNSRYHDLPLSTLGGFSDRVIRLYLSCKERRDHYRELGMLEEAAVFEGLMGQMEQTFDLQNLESNLLPNDKA